MQQRFQQDVVAVRDARVRSRQTIDAFGDLVVSASALLLGIAIGVASRLA